MLHIVWVTPAPYVFPNKIAAAADTLGDTITVTLTRPDTLEALAACCTSCDAVVLDAAPGIDARLFAERTGKLVLRPRFDKIRNHRNELESRFVEYVTINP